MNLNDIRKMQMQEHVGRLMLAHAPHWHAKVEGPLLPTKTGALDRPRMEFRLFAGSRDEAQIEIMTGIEDTCQKSQIPFSPDEWTLLDLHIDHGN